MKVGKPLDTFSVLISSGLDVLYAFCFKSGNRISKKYQLAATNCL